MIPIGRGLRTECDRPLRLTRRGVFVVRFLVGVAVVTAMTLAFALLSRPAEAGQRGGPLPVSYRVVQPGETLWRIARQVAPDTDPRDTVAELVELNALPDSEVRAGQRIAVPAAD